MPEMPAPMISTSRCSVMTTRYQRRVELVNSVLKNSTPCKVLAVSTASPARAARGRRTTRPSGDDREPAILGTADRLLEHRVRRHLGRRPRQGRRPVPSDVLLLLPVQGRRAADAAGSLDPAGGHRIRRCDGGAAQRPVARLPHRHHHVLRMRSPPIPRWRAPAPTRSPPARRPARPGTASWASGFTRPPR